jgi:hypothetical protein
VSTNAFAEGDLTRGVHSVHDGNGGFRPDGRVQRRYDIQADTIYVGTSPLGTDPTGTGWTIKKITLSSGNPTASQWTSVGTAVWNNRTSESYL